MTKLCEETCGSVQMLQANFEPGRGYSPDFSNYDAYLNAIAAFVAPCPSFMAVLVVARLLRYALRQMSFPFSLRAFSLVESLEDTEDLVRDRLHHETPAEVRDQEVLLKIWRSSGVIAF